MKKAERQQVFDKYGGKCAYCGCELQKGWHVDHIEARWHNMNQSDAQRLGMKKGDDCIENYNPACPRCNNWKGTWTLEQFRIEISEQIKRLIAYSSNYRMAKDYGLIQETGTPVVFYFETIKPATPANV